MRGTVVHLGDVGGGAWTFTAETVLRAATGDVQLHVDLGAASGLSLTAQQGSLVMDADAAIDAGLAVALAAPAGITLAVIESDQSIDVVSTAGVIRAVGAVPGGTHLRAPWVSIHGDGLALADAAYVPVADAGAVQASAIRGTTFESRGDDGRIVYQLVSAGIVRDQLRMADEGASRVLVARQELVSGAGQIVEGRPVSAVYARPLDAAPDGSVSVFAAGGSAASHYLGAPAPAAAGGVVFTTAGQGGGSLALSDLAYGFGGFDGGATPWTDPTAPLLRSTGQVVAEPLWSIDSW
jgi:hypothetical protein